jgi:RNA-directed DNA polymerase
MRDRAMQALYLLALDPVAETLADGVSFGFRRGRGCADAIEQCFKTLCHQNPSWVLEGDIKGCFDNISHQWLLDNVPLNKPILRKWLESGYLEKQVFFDTISGTPQGGIISPVLANLALNGLERRLRESFPLRGKGSERGRAAQVHLIRYADDFVITGHSEELLKVIVKPLVESFLLQRGLVLSPEKTVITHVRDGFDFLGQNVRRYPNGKLLIKPSRKSIETLLSKVKQIIREHIGRAAHILIKRLNPVIRGWANYHRHVVSKRIFARLDAAVFRMLWQWAQARHPRKGRRWIKQKYFERVGTRDWWFFGKPDGTDGWLYRVRLFHASSVKIVRHVQVRSGLNPYDPSWEPYLTRRTVVAPHRSRS